MESERPELDTLYVNDDEPEVYNAPIDEERDDDDDETVLCVTVCCPSCGEPVIRLVTPSGMEKARQERLAETEEKRKAWAEKKAAEGGAA